MAKFDYGRYFGPITPLADALREPGVELVVCAGFMRLLSSVMLEAFPNRILNTHNALLPSFPGIHSPRDAVEYGVKIAGCTVFFVTEGVDVGPVIIQAAVPVMPGDDEAWDAFNLLVRIAIPDDLQNEALVALAAFDAEHALVGHALAALGWHHAGAGRASALE